MGGFALVLVLSAFVSVLVAPPALGLPTIDEIDPMSLEVDDTRKTPEIDGTSYYWSRVPEVSVVSTASSVATGRVTNFLKTGYGFSFKIEVTALSVGTTTLTVLVTETGSLGDVRSTSQAFLVTVNASTLGGLFELDPPTLERIAEGTSRTFSVKLDRQPRTEATVSVSSSDTGAVTVSPASLTFSTTDWSTPQTVTVWGVNDADTVDETATVNLVASGGGYTGLTAAVSVYVEEPPGRPTNVAAVPGDGRVTLKWSAPTYGGQVAKWRLRYSIEGNNWTQAFDLMCGEKVCPGDTTEYTATGLSNGSRYYFEWYAVSALGAFGGSTGFVKATPVATPSKPVGVNATPGDGKAVLSWDRMAGVSGWEYRRKAGTGTYGAWTGIAGSSANTVGHTVTGIANYTRHSFQVRAFRNSTVEVGSSSTVYKFDGTASDEAHARPPAAPPARPSGLTATAGDGQAVLAWDNPSNPLITKYQLRHKAGTSFGEGDDSLWADVPNSGSGTVGHTVTGLANGTTHAFQIRAVDLGDTGPASGVATAKLPATPVKPSGFRVVPDAGRAGLRWNPIADVSRWEFRQRTGGGAIGAWTSVPGSVGSTTRYVLTGLSDGVAYGFQVRAVRGPAVGIASDEVTVTPQATVPDAPGGFLATGRAAGVSLRWNLPSNAIADSFQVRWKATHLLPFAADDVWTDVPGTTTTHLVTGLSNGVVYAYELRARNPSGTGPAASTTGTPFLRAPGKPWGLQATAGDGEVSLTWIPIATATAWQYQLKKGAGEFGDWTDIVDSGADTASHTATGLANGSTYAFRVRALRSGVRGPASDAVEATPVMTPSGLFATASQVMPDIVDLRWSATANSAVTKWQYQVAASSDSFGADWVDIPDSGAATRAYSVDDLAIGTTHWFKVRAVIGDTAQGESEARSATPQALAGWINFKMDGCSASLPANPSRFALSSYSSPIEVPVALFTADCEPLRDHGSVGDGSDWPTLIYLKFEDSYDQIVEVEAIGDPLGRPSYRSFVYGKSRIRVTPGVLNEEVREFKSGTATVAIELEDKDLIGEGPGDTLGFPIRFDVHVAVSPHFSSVADVSDQHYTLDEAISPPAFPAATGGDGKLTYSISPALPAGLVFDGDGAADLGLDPGVAPTLSGTPTSVQSWTVYTITVHDSDADQGDADSDSIDFRLRVNAGPTVANPLPDRDILLGVSETVELDSSDTPVFSDPNPDDVLNILAVSSTDAIADVPPVKMTRSGTELTVRAESPGVSTVTVYATDLGGATAIDSFTVNSVEPSLTVSVKTVALKEGGEDQTFAVELPHRPTVDVTVAVSSDDPGAATASPSSLTFTADNWNSGQTVTVSPVADGDAANESLDVSLSASGGEYEGKTGTVAVSVEDAQTPSLVLTDSPVSLSEGGTDGTFTVALSHVPTVDVTVAVSSDDPGAATASPSSLTFTADNWSATQTVTVSAATDNDAANESLDVSLSASGGEYQGKTGTASVTVADAQTASLKVVGAPVALSEGGTDGTFTVALSHVPTVDVTVAVSSDDPGAATASPSSLTFTTANWNAAQTVTVSAATDNDAANESLDVSLSASGGEYQGKTGTASVTVADAQTASLKVAGAPVALSEGGGSGTFTVTLSHVPTVEVTVAVSSDDPGAATASPSSLTFTTANWNAAQTVTVSAATDNDAANESLDVSLSASGGEYQGKTGTASVTVADAQTASLKVAGAPVALSEGGGSGTFTVTLSHVPTVEVTVAVSSDDPGAATASPSSLTFTTANWNAAQTVTVSAATDNDAANESLDVSLSASGGEYQGKTGTASVTVADAQTASLKVVGAPVDLTEGGGNRTFTVTLSHVPTVDVTVAVSSDDPGAATASPSSLTFTAANWGAAQTVTVSAATDNDAANESLGVLLSASGGEYDGKTGTVSVTVADAQTASLNVVGAPVALSEGGTDGTFTVALSHVPTVEVTVAVSSDDPGAATASPSSLTFTAANWNAAQTVTVSAATDNDAANESLDVSLSASGGEYEGKTGTVPVTVADAQTASLKVVGAPVALSEGGGNGSFTVTLSHVPTVDVTVAVSSDDPGAATASPSSLTFTTANWNAAQTVTVSAATDNDAANESLDVSLRASGGEYQGKTGTASVTVADAQTASLKVVGAPVALSEGGTDGTFTVTLSHVPTVEVTVAVSSDDPGAATASPSSLTFTAANWNTTQTVTVSAATDSDAANESLDVSLRASGGEYQAKAGTVPVTVADAQTASLKVAGAPVALSEGGGSGTFTVTLSHVPTVEVTVAVSSDDPGAATASPSSLTFTAANWNAAQTVTVSAATDNDAANESLDVSLSASGGEYEGKTGTASVTVADAQTASLKVVGAPVALSEGGTDGTFTVTLSHVPTVEVTVAVSSDDPGAATASPSSLTFTAANWNATQTVTVSAATDNDAANESLGVSLSASGGEYEGKTGTASVTVADAQTASLKVVGAPVALTEGGGNGTFTVALSHVPTVDVTVAVSSDDPGAATASPSSLTFTAANWNAAQTVTVSAATDNDAANESLDVSLSASGGEYQGKTGTASVTVADAQTASLKVAGAPVALSEGGGSGTFTVALSHVPTVEVTVAVSSDDPGAATASPSSLTFTTANWNAAQTVTVSAATDNDAANESLDVSLSASGGEYQGKTGTASVTVADAQTASLKVAGAPVALSEGGGSGTFTVTLSHVPTVEVTVAVSSDDPGAATASPSSLTFTAANWNAAQTVTVSAATDNDAANESLDVSLSASGGEYQGKTGTVPVTVADAQTASLKVAGAPVALSEGGGSGTFTVTLSHVPTVEVTVAVSSGDPGAATASPSSLTFTIANWNAAQTVTVSAATDNDAANESLDVSLSASGGEYEGKTGTVPVTVADAQTASLKVVGAPVALSEGGGSGTFTVTLSHVPTVEVTVAVSSDDPGAATASPSSLTFTTANWNAAQTVTVSAATDNDAANESLDVSLSASGGEYQGKTGTASVTVADAQTASLKVAGAPVALSEGGGSGTFTVTLSHVPTVEVTVAVSSDDPGAATASPSSLTFTAANWNAAQTVTVSAATDNDAANESLDVSLSASGGEYQGKTGTVPVTVADAQTASLKVAGAPVALSEGGGSGTFTVTLSHVPTVEVTVAVSSGDPGAATASPSSLTFTIANWNAAQTVTVSAATDNDAANESLDVSLSASGGEYQGKTGTVPVTVADAQTASLKVAGAPVALSEGGGSGTFTVTLSHVPTVEVTVAVSSDDPGAATASPSSLTFTAANWNAAQTVTVSAATDNDAANESLDVSLSASGGEYQGKTGTASVTVADAQTASLKVAGAPVALSEGGGSGTFTVTLSHVPTVEVTVAVSSDDPGAATASPSSLTFTTANWNAAQTVTVSAATDNDAANESLDVSLSASGGEYQGKTGTVPVTVADAQTASLKVAGAPVALSEGGGSGTFTVTLSHVPTVEVTVAVSSDDPGAASASPSSLTFTADNWSAAQTVTVSAATDNDAASESLDVSLSASGGEYEGKAGTVPVTVADAQTASLKVAGAPVALSEGGGSGTFTVTLSHVPTVEVTVAVSSDDPGAATASPSSLTFTADNWSAAQTVTVSAATDNDAANESLGVLLRASGGEYEGKTGTASVTVADAQTASLKVAGAPVALSEGGGNGTFTVALSHVPTVEVTVAVSSDDPGAATASPSSLTFTADNWSAAQTVTVSAATDNDAANESLDVSLSASGGAYQGKTGTASVTVADAQTASLKVAGAPVALSEVGGSGTFTVTLSHVPTVEVTVAVSSDDPGAATASPSSLTFTAANWNATQTVTVSAATDNDAANESLDVSLSASGGEYQGKAGTVPVTVADAQTASLKVVGAPVALSEGGTDGRFTVTLSHVPTVDVTVAVSSDDPGAATASPSSLTFTAANWNATQTVTVSAATDNDAANESLDVSLSASGGEYQGKTGTVPVTVADAQTASLKVVGAPVALSEGGGNGSFTVALSHVPTVDVTVAVSSDDPGAATASPSSLTFTAANWNAAQTVTVSAATDNDAANESLDVSLSASGGAYQGKTGTVPVTVADAQTASLKVAGAPVALSEGGGSGTFTVALSHVPTVEVTVAVSSDDPGAATASPSSLTFTTANWNAAQTVTVSAATDNDAANESLDVSLSASGGEYQGKTGTASVTVADAQTASLKVAGAPVALSEGGGSGTFTVTLSHVPTVEVSVAVSSDDPGAATASPSNLTFTADNWSAAQTVTVSAATDNDAANESLDISLSASGGEYQGKAGTVPVTVDDAQTASLKVVGAPVALTEGGTDGTFTVALSHVPTVEVTVAVSSDDPGAATASPSSLTFTTANWNATQTVTVSAATDNDAANESLDVSLSASGGEYQGKTGTASVTVADAQTASLKVAGAPVALSEGGGNGSFTVALSHVPTVDVTVAVSSDDPGAATASPSSLTFTAANWNAAQTVTVSAATDNDAANESLDVSLSASGGEYQGKTGTVPVTVADAQTASLTVVGAPLALSEGGTDGTFTVALSHVPTVDVTVAVSSDDPGAATASPSSLTFTADNWNAAQTVTVSAATDNDAANESLDVSLSASGGAYQGKTGTVPVTVADAQTASLKVAGAPVALSEGGGSGTFTVALSHVPTVEVTVAVSSDDPGAATASPSSLTFTTANWNAAQTVTVSAATDNDAANESLDVSLSASGGEYQGKTGTASVTVADAQTASLKVAGAPVALSEGGGSGTFTVTLSHVPTVEVSVAVSSDDPGAATASPSNLTFTADNWSAAQTVTVSAATDNDAANESLDISLSASGGEYEGKTGTASVTVADAQTASLKVVGAPVALSEGGTDGTFTVALSHVPTVDVTVAVSSEDPGAATASPSSLTFTAANWNAAQAVTVSAAPDNDAANESLGVSLSASGGEYQGKTGTASVTVADAQTASLKVVGAPVALSEGGTDGTFTVALSHVPTVEVTVAVSSDDPGAATASPSSLTFTADNWSAAQTVTVSAATDNDAANESLDVSLSASGGEYQGKTGTVPVTVADAQTASLKVVGAPVALSEGGGNGTFTVTLSHVPTVEVTVAVSSDDPGAATAGPSSLTFTADNWNAAQTVTVSAATDNDAANESLDVSLSASGGAYQGKAGTVPVTVADAQTASLKVVGAPVAVTEGGGSGTFTVALSHVPTVEVTVAVSSDDPGAATASPSSLTFTADNWNAAQTVTVSAATDNDAANESLGVSLSASGGEYQGKTGTVPVTVADAQTASLKVVGAPIALSEGGTDGTFTVALSHVPTVEVTVAVSSDDPGAATASPASLTFTIANWNTGQTVTVSPVADGDAANESLDVSLSASGGEYEGKTGTASVTVADAQTASLKVVGAPVALSEGGTDGTFTVALSHVPTVEVTVAVSSDDPGAAAASPASLTFTTANWNTGQTVTVSPVADGDAANESLGVSLSASGGEYQGKTGTASVTVADAQTASLKVVGAPVALSEGGGSGTFTVALSHVPTVEVTVAVSSDDPGAATASPSSLTFTTDNWNAAQTVTVSAATDNDAANESLDVSLSASGGEYQGKTGTASVTVSDAQTASLKVVGAPVALSEGGTDGTFTVALSHVPTVDVTVAVSSDDPGAATASPSSLTFTADNWNAVQKVTVSAATDNDAANESLDVSLSASGGEYQGKTGTVPVTVADAQTASLKVVGAPVALSEGGTDGTFTVALSHVPTVEVTVAVSSDDPGAAAASPASLTFTTANWNTGQTVTVSPVADGDAANESLGVSLSASGGEYQGKTGTASVTVADAQTASLKVVGAPVALTEGGGSGTFTVTLSHVPTVEVTVAVSSDDPGAATASPSSLTFTTDNWNAAQTVTVSAATDNDAANESLDVSLRASGGEYQGKTGTASVTVADAQTASLKVAGAPVALSEGGTDGTFTVTLSHVPTVEVTVAVSSDDPGAATASPSSLTFTTANWNAAQTVTVSAATDNDAANESLDVSLSASGGEYEGKTGTASVTVADAQTASLKVAGAPVTLSEGGGSGTFTVALSHVPTVEVTVAVSSDDPGAATASPSSLTFTADNWNAAQTVTVLPVADGDAANESLGVSLSASGGEYEGKTGAASVTVADAHTASLKVAGAPVALSEGGTDGTFTVTLSHVPTFEVKVAVSSDDPGAATASPASLTFTTANWNTGQTVTVSPVADGDAANESLGVSLSASGGEYQGKTGTASVTVADAQTASLKVVGAPVALTEGGGSGTFTVTLSHVPTVEVTVAVSSDDPGAATASPSSLTFTTDNWNAAQTVTVSAATDNDAANESLDVSLRASGGEYQGKTGTASVTVADAQTASLKVAGAPVALSEGGTDGTFTVTLSHVPTVEVTVAVSSDDPGAATASPSSLTFTTANWNAAQTVTVSAATDNDAANESLDVSLSASGGEYEGKTGTASVTVADAQTASLKVAGAPVALSEGGGSGTFTVALSHVPTVEVTVAVSSDDPGAATASPSSLTFTADNWNAAQTVTVLPVADGDAANESLGVSLSASGGEYEGKTGAASVTVADAHTASLKVAGAPVALSEGGTDGTFTVTLSHVPTFEVKVAVSSDDPGAATASPASLTFTTANWNTGQTVTVSPVADGDAANESLGVSLSASGGEYQGKTGTASVTVADAQTASLKVVGAPVALTEGGGSGTFTVTLSHVPTVEVTVAVSSDDPGAATASPSSLTFTTDNWNAAQTVTVSAATDNDAANESLDVSLRASGGEYQGKTGTASVTVADAQTASLKVAGAPVALSEGGTDGTFTVTLSHVPTVEVTVAVSSDDPGAATASPSSLTFTTANWNAAQTVTVSAATDNDAANESLDVSLSASGGEYEGKTGTASVTVADAQTASLKVAGAPVALSEGGGSGTFTVALSHVPTVEVTVAVSSDDPGAATASPSSLTFTADNWNAAQTVTVLPVADGDAANESLGVSLSASGGEYEGKTGAASVTVADAHTASLKVAGAPVALSEGGTDGTFTVTLSHVPTFEVKVAVSSDDPGAATASPASLTFTTANWNTGQTVTVSPVADGDAANESLDVSLSASGGEYEGKTGTASVTVADAQTASLKVAGAPVALKEGGGNGTFTVTLSHVPTVEVTVAVSSDDPGAATASPSSLTFTAANWNAAQTVTVSPVDDEDAADESLDVSLTASGGEYEDVTETVSVTVGDNAAASFYFEGAPVVLKEGERGTFSVSLTMSPTGEVTVTVEASGDVFVTSGAILTFNPDNYARAQTVYLRAEEDTDNDSERVEVSVNARGGGYDSVTGSVMVEVTDNGRNDRDERTARRLVADIARQTLFGAVEVVGNRFDVSPDQSRAILAGHRLGIAEGGSDSLGRGSARKVGSVRATMWDDELIGDSVDDENLLKSSSFVLRLDREGEKEGADWTLWGAGDWRGFTSAADFGSYDGSLSTGWLGVDARLGDALRTGVAVSRASGGVDFLISEGEGRVETRVTGIYPYFSRRADRSWHLLLGLANGTIETRFPSRSPERAGIEMAMGSAAADWSTLWAGGGTQLTSFGNLDFVHAETDGAAETIGGISVDGWRMRAGVEASHTGIRVSGSETVVLAPQASLAMRQDGGDGVTGTGVEVTGDMRLWGWERLHLEVSGQRLLVHSDERTREWAATVQAHVAPGVGGRGWSASVEQLWGIARDGVLDSDRPFASGNLETASAASTHVKARYGIGASGGLWIPYAEAVFTESASRSHRFAAGVEIYTLRGINATASFELSEVESASTRSRVYFMAHVRF